MKNVIFAMLSTSLCLNCLACCLIGPKFDNEDLRRMKSKEIGDRALKRSSFADVIASSSVLVARVLDEPNSACGGLTIHDASEAIRAIMLALLNRDSADLLVGIDGRTFTPDEAISVLYGQLATGAGFEAEKGRSPCIKQLFYELKPPESRRNLLKLWECQERHLRERLSRLG